MRPYRGSFEPVGVVHGVTSHIEPVAAEASPVRDGRHRIEDDSRMLGRPHRRITAMDGFVCATHFFALFPQPPGDVHAARHDLPGDPAPHSVGRKHGVEIRAPLGRGRRVLGASNPRSRSWSARVWAGNLVATQPVPAILTQLIPHLGSGQPRSDPGRPCGRALGFVVSDIARPSFGPPPREALLPAPVAIGRHPSHPRAWGWRAAQSELCDGNS